MSELLPTWAEVPFSAITLDASQRIPLAEEVIRYIDIGSVNRNSKSIESPQELLGKDAPSRARKQVAFGDTLVSMTRPNLNAVALVPNELDGQIASTGFDVLRPIPGIDPRWISYLVRTEAFVGAMSDLVQGALYPAVRSKDVRAYVVPLAPQTEQTRIANQLDTLLTRVQTCNDRFDAIFALLKRFRQAVLDAATSGRLTEDWRDAQPNLPSATTLIEALADDVEAAGGHIRGNASDPTEDAHDLTAEKLPDGWKISTLRDCCTPGRPITYGILKPGPELENGIPYIRVADFPGNQLKLTGIKKTSPDIDLQFKRARLIAGDLLLSIRGSVGRLIEIPDVLEGANITQDTARLSINKRLNSRYVYFVLLAPDTQRRMANAIRGVAVRGINIGDVRALQLPIPSALEQTEIVRRVEAMFALADSIEARCTTARTQAQRLTPLVLAKAFRGELVPQDPNDEPASDLLNRIAAAQSLTPIRHVAKAATRRTPKVKQQDVSPSENADEPLDATMKLDLVPDNYLETLISAVEGVNAKELWQKSKLGIDDFYIQLSKEIGRGLVEVDVQDKSKICRSAANRRGQA